MKTAGVRDLKAHLSSYLRDVQRGEVLLITDNGRVVAEIHAPGTAANAPVALPYPRLMKMGAVRLAPDPDARGWTRPPTHPQPPGTAQALIDAERGE